MITKIQFANNQKFKAKYYPYPKTSSAIISEKFEQATSKYPQYILKQDDISFCNNDYFILMEEGKQNIKAHGYFGYTRKYPKDVDNMVKRLVNIFNSLMENPVPKIHIDRL